MKTRFLFTFGLIVAALFVTSEAALYFFSVQQSDNRVSQALDSLASSSGELEKSLAANDAIRFHVLCEELQRKVFQIPNVVGLRIEHQTRGPLFSATTAETSRQIKEQSRLDRGFRFIAQYELLDSDAVALLLKAGLIIILIWLGVSIIALVAYSSAKPEPASSLAADQPTTPPVEPQPSSPEPIMKAAAIHPVEPSKPEAVSEPPLPPKVYSQPTELAATTPAESAPVAAESLLPPMIAPPPVKETKTPLSEFLYRLDKEISRCAEFAVELALCLIKLPKLKEPAPARSRIETEFVHEDLVFQLDKHQFAVILPHHDLDQGLARSELFMKSIDRDSENNPELANALLGLASRSSRLIDGQRLYKEAVIALRKANAKQGRLVGFRADPTRYRDYLTHQKI